MKPYATVEAGTTPQFTWVGSTDPSSLTVALKTKSETLVASGAAVSSGAGSGKWYFFGTVPDSFGKYPTNLLVEWTATASTHAGNSTQFVYRLNIEVTKTTPWGPPR